MTTSADPTAVAQAYARDIVRMFSSYRALGDAALTKTPDEHLHTEIDPNSNSMAIVVKHLAGNLRSRYRDFLTTDGEKPDRDRDREFEMPEPAARDEILRWWNEAWAIAMAAIEALTADDLGRTITIRGEAFLVIEALDRSVTHTAYHVGQMVYLARHFAGSSWNSLSIPRGQSGSFARGEYKQGIIERLARERTRSST